MTLVSILNSIAITGFLISSIYKYKLTITKRKQIEQHKIELENLEKIIDSKTKAPQITPKKIVFDCPTVDDLVSAKIDNFLRKTNKPQIKSTKLYKTLESPPIKPILPNLPPIIKNYSEITDFQKEWKNRLERHKKVCKLYPEKKPIFNEWLSDGPEKQLDSYSLVDIKHKVVYCELPKCGCTNWKNTIRRMMELKDLKENEIIPENAGWWNYTKKNGRKKRSPLDPGSVSSISNALKDAMKEFEDNENREKALKSAYNAYRSWYRESTKKHTFDILEQNFTPEEKVNIYSNGTYFRFLFVRHPLERLLSGYRNKIQPLFLNRPLLNGIWDEVSSDEQKLEKYKELDVHGFHAFMRYLIIRGKSPYGGGTVRHWKRYYDLCRVCGHDWDFIGKMETIFEDSEEVFKRAGVSGRVHYGYASKSTDYEKMVRYYKGLPKSVVLKVYEMFEVDFEIFGYDIPDWLWSHLSNK